MRGLLNRRVLVWRQQISSGSWGGSSDCDDCGRDDDVIVVYV